mmetsp:Transcript_18120/g.39494  ORF Transcript_18120/g.39494 Transcript_18120/m.39494 type:complete len:265 (-) Transcript_18120:1651-2445(-)|eukprot:CAMPEP_0168197862 /NCGR_PEP_ID=MMETSP0139_2-20121125/21428_1 /TAXON_ID=44445 /ORGANISM="Pseudo-nitzschia australis, Strain 10249 10 AB" /LENGTH=264 /DNA_ID=CAMNT_0008122437 /DNA_START=203 /DNA_END=997 /DNA_ORIENTATION=-
MTAEYDLGDSDVPVDIDNNLVDSISAPPLQGANPDFDPKVFWSVNALLLFLICLSAIWCCFMQKHFYNETDRLNRSDEIYRARRRRRLEEKNMTSPEERRRKLLANFSKHKVEMTVKEEDLIQTYCNDSDTEDSSTTDVLSDDNYLNDKDVETGDMSSNSSMSLGDEETGHLKLRDGTGRLVPNCCAICLSRYKVGDVVAWSSNPSCIHAFHRECVIDWLVKMQPETPCPCCRQEFTDLESIRNERKIKWTGRYAFDFSSISLW